MQRGLSKSVKKAVVKNHLQGMNESENTKSVGSSASGQKLTTEEIDSVIEEFNSEASTKGLDSASKDYGVSGIVKELSEMARFKRDNDLEFSSILEGSRIAGTLKKFGAGMPEFEQFLDSVYARSLERGFTPNEIISQSSKLQSLEKKYGTTYDVLRTNFEELGKSVAAKKKEKSDLEAEISQITKKKAETLARHSLDEQKIQDYLDAKQQLAALGLDIVTLPNMKNFLVALKNEKFDPREIMNKLNSIGDLQSQRIRSLQEAKTAKDDLDSKKIYLAEIKKLEESKLSFDQIERIRSLVTRISLDHKIEPSQAYGRFEQDILQNYNVVLGLKPEVARLEDAKKRLEAEISAKKNEFETLEVGAKDRIKKLDERYSKQKEEIEAYSELRALGIDGKRILSWNQIIKSANLDYGAIEGELRNQGNLKNLEDKTSAKIKELMSQEIKLTQAVAELNSDKEKIEASIQTVKDNALSGIEELRVRILSSLSNLQEKAQSGLEETSRGGQKSLDELKTSVEQQIKQSSATAISEMSSTVTDLKSSVSDFSKELKDTISGASTEIKNVGVALEAGEKIGKYRNVLPLLQLIDGSGTQDESEALIAMWNLSSRFNAWLENQYPGEKRDISEPLTRLLESINNEIQRVGGA